LHVALKQVNIYASHFQIIELQRYKSYPVSAVFTAVSTNPSRPPIV